MKKKKRKVGSEKMSIYDKVNEWLEIAKEDLEVAGLCFSNNKYLHCAYMCQQALEKTLKAYIAAADEIPMPIHHLPQLAQDAGLWDMFDAENHIFLRAMTTYAIEARYPERKIKLKEACKKEEAERILQKTKEMVKWLEEKIQEKLSQNEPSSSDCKK